jgi:cytidylate kinase
MAQLYSSISHIRGKRDVNFKLMGKAKAIGIKDFLVTIERHRAFNYFIDRPDIKIIYLHRDNIIKRHISGLFMRENSLPVSYKAVQHNRIKLDIEATLKSLKILSQEVMREKQFIDKLKAHSILEIDYEEYFKSAESIIKWNGIIFEFLGIEPIAVTSNQKKILPTTLKDIVSNYDEVVENLKNTEYEKFLY